MLLTKLKLNYFGRFRNREIDLKPGINLIYGDNEAGKSTIHTFVKGMFFGIERLRGRGAATREDLYTRYLPWDYPGAFSGSMDIRVGDKDYRLQRSFHASDKSFMIMELSTGREIRLKDGQISELIPGLTESAYRNTISIEQLKAQTDSELAAEVRNYITNLSVTKSKEVNVAKAVSVLTEQRKQLELARNMAELKALQAEIAEGLEKEVQLERLTLQLGELLAKEAELKAISEKIKNLAEDEETARMEQLPAILEKYRSYQELLSQTTSMELKEKELNKQIITQEQGQMDAASLREAVRTAEDLSLRVTEADRQEQELRKEQEVLRRTAGKDRLLGFLPALILVVIVAAVGGIHPWSIGVILAILFIGTVITVVKEQVRKRKSAELERRIAATQDRKTDAGKATEELLKRNRVTRIEELTKKQEDAVKISVVLENAKLQKTELEQRLKELEDSRDIQYEIIMKYMQFFVKEDELNSLSIQRLEEEIRRRRQDSRGKAADINEQTEACRLKCEKLRWEIAALEGNEEQLLKNQERYIDLEKKQKEGAIELEALNLALSTIQELSTDIHDSFGQQLNQAVSGVIRDVTGHKYDDLKIDEKLEVKVGWNGDYVLLDRLSAGTIDQVYFALRLAVADLLLGKDEVPLLLDDSFAFYDETRVKAALFMIAQRQQTILFSCHKREQELLEELGIPYHLVDLSCR